MRSTHTTSFALLLCFTATSVVAQPGTLDPSFSTDGIGIYQPGTLHDVGHGVATLPDTTLLVCGVAWQNGAPSAFVTHILQNGDIDTDFGTNGYTFFDAGEEAYLYDIAVADDGSIYACGTAYPTFTQQTLFLVHLAADGTPDGSFGNNGMITTAIATVDAEAQSMVLDADQRIVIAGRAGFGNLSDALLVRYLPNGELDDSFSGDGVFTAVGFPNDEDGFHAVDLLSDGSIVAAGYSVVNFLYRSIVMRVDPVGLPVAIFGDFGLVSLDLAGNEDEAWGITASGLQCLITGYQATSQSDRDVFVTRLDGFGDPVTGFGTNGTVTFNTNANELGFDITAHTNGTFVICGTTGDFGFVAPRDLLLLRITSDGDPDASFGTEGVVITPVQQDFDDANAVAIQPDNKIVITGFTSGFSLGTDNDLVVARYLDEEITSVEAMDAKGTEITLFPSPSADGLLTLVAGGNMGLTEISVFDARGAQVKATERLQLGERPVRLDLSALPQGIYRVRIQQGSTVLGRTVVLVR